MLDWSKITDGMLVKRDLQPFLPVGYRNPLRVAQHH